MIYRTGVALALLLTAHLGLAQSLSAEPLSLELLPIKSSPSHLLSELAVSATLKRASVPACPKENARQLSLSLIEGQVQGHLRELSLDLTCSHSRLNNEAEPADNDALSLLLTLPAIDFKIDNLTLQLAEGRVSGPAELHHQQQQLSVSWQTETGTKTATKASNGASAEADRVQLNITPDRQGWRWQGQLPGHLLTPNLRQPVRLSGGWQPEQPLTVKVAGALPTPLSGNWQLALAAKQAANGWQLQPSSQLSIPRLTWKDLTLNRITVTPQGELALNKPWQASVSWQQGNWKKGRLPAASLQLQGASLTHLQGKVRADLNHDLQLTGSWRYDQGLALTVPTQSVSAASTWAWLNDWLLLPVGVSAEAGQLRVSLNAANLFNTKVPILMTAELNQGQLKYRDMLAEELAAKVKLSWRSPQGFRSLGPQAVSAARLNVGVPITDIHGALRWQADGLWLSGLTAQVFDGHIALSPMALNAKPSGEAHFSDIALEKLLSYANVDGLTGSGSLKGRLPFVYDRGLSVKNGRAESHDGWISYQAGEQLAATGEANISLGLTLGLLSDLRYDKLSADISMAGTGEAVINSHLQGRAPVKGKLHPVNFNYHHQENLLQLLASLRFAQDLTERLPASLQGESE